MVNSRGWLRIVEASIAVLIVFGTIIIVLQANKTISDDDYSSLANQILREIGENNTLREDIISYDLSGALEGNNKIVIENLDTAVKSRLQNPYFKHSIIICKLNDNCEPVSGYPAGKDVYVSERIISASLLDSDYDPRKLKLFIWIDR